MSHPGGGYVGSFNLGFEPHVTWGGHPSKDLPLAGSNCISFFDVIESELSSGLLALVGIF